MILSFLFPAMVSSAADKNSDFVVVIDAGHGGHDTGACDNGVKEKDINLAVAKALQADIQKKIKGAKVVMTRSNDTFVTLQGRADIANKNRADLFISIHTNSVDAKNPNRKSVTGTSVYALGLHKDKNNLDVAKRENSVIELESNHQEKYSGFDPSKDESYIIFEMAQKKNLEQSLRFANYAQKQLVSHAGRADRGVKQAGFWVLWATSMPSVLVELDFICNPKSAAFMGSDEGVKKLAAALCNAVEQYYNSSKASSAKRTSLNARRNNDANSVSYAKSSNVRDENLQKVDNTPTPAKEEMSVNEEGKALAVVERAARNDVPPAVANNASDRRRTSAARKRRSASAKLASAQRDVATKSIVVKSETDYLAKAEVKKTIVAKEETKPVVKETPKERKKRLAMEKKQKEKELKEKEALKKKQAKKSQNNSKNKNNSQKKIVVTNKEKIAYSQTSEKNNETITSSAKTKERKSLNSKHK